MKQQTYINAAIAASVIGAAQVEYGSRMSKWRMRKTAQSYKFHSKAMQMAVEHALTIGIYETGSKMNAAMLASLRARITDIVDAVKNEREWELAVREGGAIYEWSLEDAKAHTDAMCAKHEGEGVSEEAITSTALEREGFVKVGPDESHALEYWRNGKVCVMFYGTTPAVWVENGSYDWQQSFGFGVECEVVAVDDCPAMQRINWLVRLFTAPVQGEEDAAND